MTLTCEDVWPKREGLYEEYCRQSVDQSHLHRCKLDVTQDDLTWMTEWRPGRRSLKNHLKRAIFKLFLYYIILHC